jgi:hypothetical protein
MKLPDESFSPRRPENRKGTRSLHLGSHHDKPRDPKAVISMKMADSQNPERLDPELHLSQIDLAAFASIKDIYLSLKLYRYGGKEPSGHGHHAP